MKEEQKHAGLNGVKRQARAAGSGVLNAASSREIKRRTKRVAVQRQRSREIKIRIKTEEYRRLSQPYSTVQRMVLAAALLSFFVFSVLMVMSESVLKTTMTEVNALRSSYEKLSADNDAMESNIESGVDAEEIFRAATKELGMTYPKKSQVIVYQKSESEHVKQNEDIPKE